MEHENCESPLSLLAMAALDTLEPDIFEDSERYWHVPADPRIYPGYPCPQGIPKLDLELRHLLQPDLIYTYCESDNGGPIYRCAPRRASFLAYLPELGDDPRDLLSWSQDSGFSQFSKRPIGPPQLLDTASRKTPPPGDETPGLGARWLYNRCVPRQANSLSPCPKLRAAEKNVLSWLESLHIDQSLNRPTSSQQLPDSADQSSPPCEVETLGTRWLRTRQTSSPVSSSSEVELYSSKAGSDTSEAGSGTSKAGSGTSKAGSGSSEAGSDSSYRCPDSSINGWVDRTNLDEVLT